MNGARGYFNSLNGWRQCPSIRVRAARLADMILAFAGQIAEEDRWSLIHFLQAGHSLEEEQ